MTPADILPYYFACEPAPTDARSAFAVARSVADGADAGVSIILEDQHVCIEVFRFSRLGDILIAWSADGRLLAFAQGSTLMVRDANGKLQMSWISDEIQSIGFDRNERLWSLAGGRLESRLGHFADIVIDDVECVAIADFAAYCRREETGLYAYFHDGTTERRLAFLLPRTHIASVQLSLQGKYLVIVLASAVVKGRSRVRIVRIELLAPGVDWLMDERVAFGFNGGPAIHAVVSDSGEVFAAYESGACSRVWRLAPGVAPEPVSPEGLEIFDFAIDASGMRLAIVGSDTRSATGAFERQLLLARRERAAWRFSAPLRAVYQMPRWRHDGKLEVLCGNNGRWTKQIIAPGEADTVSDLDWCTGVHVSKENVEYDYFRLPGPRHRQASIILLPRLHQQFVAGAQSFFFHQLLFSIARELAISGYNVVAFSGPGAIGRGRRQREPAGSYFAAFQAAIKHLAQSLITEGSSSLGILAGSLAAVPALRLLGPGSLFSASAFVAPLFEASISVTDPVRHSLLDDPCIESMHDAMAKMEVPTLVVHGARDEVVPSWQITQLRQHTRNADLVEMCVMEDEGHIFQAGRSWRQAHGEIEDFFMSHLA